MKNSLNDGVLIAHKQTLTHFVNWGWRNILCVRRLSPACATVIGQCSHSSRSRDVAGRGRKDYISSLDLHHHHNHHCHHHGTILLAYRVRLKRPSTATCDLLTRRRTASSSRSSLLCCRDARVFAPSARRRAVRPVGCRRPGSCWRSSAF